MSLGNPVFQRGVAMALFLCSGAFLAFAGDPWAADQSILFSAPKGGVLTTNFSQLSVESPKLQDDFSSLHPFSSGGSQSSLSPVPPRRVIMENGGVRELLNRQKDWASTPDEAMRSYMIKEFFGGRDPEASGRSTSSDSEIELYYQRLSRTGSVTNAVDRNDSTGLGKSINNLGGDAASNPFAALTSKRSPNPGDSLAPASARPDRLTDLLGFNQQIDPAAAAAALRLQQMQDSQIEAFKTMLNGQAASPAGVFNGSSSPSPFAGMASPASVVSGQHSAFDPIVGTIGPGAATPVAPHAPGVDDLMPRARAPGMPLAPGQTMEVPKAPSAASRAKSAEPSFDAPLRRF